MPIRPEHRHLYPPDWTALTEALKEAAGWRCTCTGECGRDHGGRCVEVHGEPATWRRQSAIVSSRPARVVLTVGHRNHRPDDCSPANLAVWCQDCHLRHDRPEHARRRRATWAERRRARELAHGRSPRQLRLALPEPPPPPGLAAAEREARQARAASAAIYAAELRGQHRFHFTWRQAPPPGR